MAAAPIIFQHYEVLVREDGTPWELGRGAMGVTYKALDTNLRVPVALKIIHPGQLNSEQVAQRFVREARAAARLRHPHIAAVYHLGKDRETWFYAMEFIEGETSDAVVNRDGPLREATVLSLATQAARALQAAEQHELVHRDIKPSNLMLMREDQEWLVKLIDFGLARTFADGETDEDLAAVTMTGFVGTPYYASPEQLDQRELDIRSDIYSLGVTLWFLLTGRVPFTGSVVSVLSQHLSKPPPLEQLAGFASPATQGLLKRMLEKDPAARPQNSAELRNEIEACRAQLTTSPAVVISKQQEPLASATEEEAAETLVAPLPAPDLRSLEAIEPVADLGFARLCRARESESGRLFGVLQLDAQNRLSPAALARLRKTVERAQAIKHPQVRETYGLEQQGDGWRLVVEWTDGCAWQQLLRIRQSLPAEEALPLVEFVAQGIDAILAAGEQHPDVAMSGIWCEMLAPESTDVPVIGVKVSPFGWLRTLSLESTWAGGETFAGHVDLQGVEPGSRGAIRALARISYETLGGADRSGAFPPLPALTEQANEVLQTALRTPGKFQSAADFSKQLVAAQGTTRESRVDTPAPAETVRSDASTVVKTSTLAKTTLPPKTSSRSEATAVTKAPERPPASAPLIEEPTADSEPVPVIESPVEAVEEAPSVPARAEEAPALQIVAPQETSRIEKAPAPRARPQRAIVAAAAVLLAGVGASIWFAPHPRKSNSATPAPSTASIATPTPTPLVTNATPSPRAPEPPPPKSRADQVRERQEQAESLQASREWKESALTWLALAQEGPEGRNVAEFGLELLLREVRWRFTPRNERAPELSRTDVESLLPAAEQAAGLGVPAAMLLLGQYHTKPDWRKAIEWYEKARSRAPKATTRIGLVLASKSAEPRDLERALECFTEAADKGDLDGKYALAECNFYGTVANHPVKGLVKNERRAVEILREVIAGAGGSGGELPYADTKQEEVYETQPNRSRHFLGSIYFQFELLPAPQRPQWYRDEANQIDHRKELRELFTAASRDWPEAFGFLGMAAAQGIGGAKNAEEATRYFKRGIDRDDPLSMFNYAQHLCENQPGNQVPKEARALFIRAAEKGHVLAMKFCKEHDFPFKQPAG